MTLFPPCLSARERLSSPGLAAASSIAAAAILALVAATPAAAQVPADAVLRDFEPTGEFVLEVDGVKAEGAEIYRSDRAAVIMLISSKLPQPTLLQPRAGTVDTVSIMQLARRDDGSIDILASAELTPAGRFEIDGQAIRFSLGEHALAVMPKPHLLGLHAAQELLADKPEYSRRAASYAPYEPSLELLRGVQGPVKVRVYFGSWCPACARMVPSLLKVTEELEGSAIDFEFYGLPQPFGDEAAAKRDGVNSVPTGIVYRGGEEVGRIQQDGWKIPEATLAEILTGKSKA